MAKNPKADSIASGLLHGADCQCHILMF